MIRKLACPSCGVTLRVAATLAAGKRIKCPKCSEGFPIPAAEDAAAEDADAVPLPRKPRRPMTDDDDDDRPAPRKRRRKPKKAAGISPVLLVLLIGGALLLVTGAAVTAGAIVWSKKHSAAVAETNSSAQQQVAQGPSEPAPMRPGRGRGQANRSQGMERGPSRPSAPPQQAQQPQQPEQPADGAGPAGSESNVLAEGRRVFEAHNCTRCHSMGGRRSRGPDLSAVGRSPEHTVDWLMNYVRDPKSQRPNSRMPSFAGKISELDLRALATYLASLK